MNKPLSDILQNHAECPGVWEDQMIAYFQDNAPQQQSSSLDRDLTIDFRVKSIAFQCFACGKDLVLEKRSRAAMASGVFCLCGQGVQYYIKWDEMILKMLAAPQEQEKCGEK